MVAFRERLTSRLDELGLGKSGLASVFEEMDVSGRGELNVKELSTVFIKLNFHVSKARGDSLLLILLFFATRHLLVVNYPRSSSLRLGRKCILSSNVDDERKSTDPPKRFPRLFLPMSEASRDLHLFDSLAFSLFVYPPKPLD